MRDYCIKDVIQLVKGHMQFLIHLSFNIMYIRIDVSLVILICFCCKSFKKFFACIYIKQYTFFTSFY